MLRELQPEQKNRRDSRSTSDDVLQARQHTTQAQESLKVCCLHFFFFFFQFLFSCKRNVCSLSLFGSSGFMFVAGQWKAPGRVQEVDGGEVGSDWSG